MVEMGGMADEGRYEVLWFPRSVLIALQSSRRKTWSAFGAFK
jgi:hypothetical protein